ncbi:MAG: asparagine synthase (glutamine-hydrolyzing) [Deltaproteobacteria bacterium]|nr:asparagine synthase (glutamine-hydrolyzing) [Deltaproteobacteria bacterium]
MCGVVGAVGGIDEEIRAAVRAMNASQQHRGPDDDGFFESEQVMFGFRRLAIIDLSADGHQPMIDSETGHVIVFNGEIYNYLEIKAELEASGTRFVSKSDTEVLLKAYARWGLDMLPRVAGMFVFALWDASRRSVVLARDRLGIKPLYVTNVARPGKPPVTLFASELRSLLASGLVDRRLSAAGLATYLWNGFVFSPPSIVEGIDVFPAGTVQTLGLDGQKTSSRVYWTLPEAGAREDVDRVRDVLRTTTRQHLLADVPLGVFLSGGIDSSAVTALAKEVSAGDVRTFNVCFEEAEFDESLHARRVAQAVGTTHTEVPLSESAFRRDLDAALQSIDQPTFDAINTYFVSKAVREAGVTVALAGTGGDELFGGYDSFSDLPRAQQVSRYFSRVPAWSLRQLGRLVARVKLGKFGEVAPQTRWGKLGDVLATRGDVLELYQIAYGLYTEAFLGELFDIPWDAGVSPFGIPTSRVDAMRSIASDPAKLHAISRLELSSFIGERLLRDTDAASMAVSLEVRVPLLDHRVVEAVASLAAPVRFEPLGRKRLLRQMAMGSLDPALFDRPKSGFVLPIERWCRAQLRGDIEETLGDFALCRSVGLDRDAVLRLWRAFQADAPGIYWSRVWGIFVLLAWCRRHKVTL